MEPTKEKQTDLPKKKKKPQTTGAKSGATNPEKVAKKKKSQSAKSRKRPVATGKSTKLAKSVAEKKKSSANDENAAIKINSQLEVNGDKPRKKRPRTEAEKQRARQRRKRQAYEARMREQKKKEFRLQIIITSLILVLSGVLLFGAVMLSMSIGTGKVVGDSMEPTLETKEKVVYLKHEKLDAFDIVAFVPPTAKSSDEYYVKRIVGMPGDSVQYEDGILTINNQSLKEKYVANTGGLEAGFDFEDIIENTPGLAGSLRETTEIPKDMYLVLGDNRENSEDSRTFGLISKDDIAGVVRFRYSPFNKFGSVR
ncbi:signal peptidase I [Enterococcus sp. PF1-24]|uniref:signal peptidase I n=1 Tax=unclassified Enterococcus TaxID=2608891 RepID=UPI0024746394|nr:MULTISPECIES: signal peptidase I [unclassified Enterococcus]MDH6364191.1 signal peptidase I [Enterococcus sp. PFB1-1]MDH6401292.1 signal peptidase I [Enterococcus sp. PF1-24]